MCKVQRLRCMYVYRGDSRNSIRNRGYGCGSSFARGRVYRGFVDGRPEMCRAGGEKSREIVARSALQGVFFLGYIVNGSIGGRCFRVYLLRVWEELRSKC